jgi:hypothetical protein
VRKAGTLQNTVTTETKDKRKGFPIRNFIEIQKPLSWQIPKVKFFESHSMSRTRSSMLVSRE